MLPKHDKFYLCSAADGKLCVPLAYGHDTVRRAFVSVATGRPSMHKSAAECCEVMQAKGLLNAGGVRHAINNRKFYTCYAANGKPRGSLL